jgi:putative pyruvate formate lyase activating enzyme
MWKILRPDASEVLNDDAARKSLNRYFAVTEDNKPAKFSIAKRLAANYNEQDSTEKLWEMHARLLAEFIEIEEAIDNGEKNLRQIPHPIKSFLDLKIEIAKRILVACHLCARGCRTNRLEGALGYCKCGSQMTVSSIFEHTGEEPELVPSGTIFTMGCTMRCKHCQNWTISQWKEAGKTYDAQELAREVEQLRSDGCRNINLVGGEPTPWLRQWINVFKIVNVNVPIVWNSNAYYSQETAALLAGFVDVYLLDFKYGLGRCAEKISEASGYWDICTRNHLEAQKFGEIIIRILVLPNHLECCTKPIINWIAENLGVQTRVNIMFQYRPQWRASEMPELRRRLQNVEIDRAIDLAEEAGLVNFIT